jgi:hypothetical protein
MLLRSKDWTKLGLFQYELKEMLNSCTDEELDQLLRIATEAEQKHSDRHVRKETK